MYPFIIESIAAERARDLRQAAGHHRDARAADGRRLRQRRATGAPGIVRLLPARLRWHMS